MGAVSSGFQVDPEALQNVAGELGKTAADWTAVQDAFARGTTIDTAALGDPSVCSAWTGFVSAWTAELQDSADALAEVTTKTESTAHVYAETEARTTTQLTPR